MEYPLWEVAAYDLHINSCLNPSSDGIPALGLIALKDLRNVSQGLNPSSDGIPALGSDH